MLRFVTYAENGRTQPGILTRGEDGVVALSTALGRPVADMIGFIAEHGPEEPERLRTVADTLRPGENGCLALGEVRILAPIPRPIHDIICVGVNYHAHRKEAGENLQASLNRPVARTVYFSKRAVSIVGPEGVIESHRALDPKLDYEVELAVVIGTGGRDIPPERAEEHIFGYAVFNDISARTLQNDHIQWYRGKSLDTFAVMGPAIVHRSGLPFPLELDVRSSVNGEARQSSNTRHLIAGIGQIVAEVSMGMTLEPGDIIATGTPAGVGMGFSPQRFMSPGDTVECEIEGIGTLRNYVR